MNCRGIVSRLERFAPLKYSESWDNTGLLIEPADSSAVVQTMMLTNDLTEAVMEEAKTKKVNFILSYHPPIFKPLKSITQKHWKERIVLHCISNSIALYSPHTAYDALSGGVNDWLATAFGAAKVSPLVPCTNKPEFSHKVSLSGNLLDKKLKAISSILETDFPATSYRFDATTPSVYCSHKDLASILNYLSVFGGISFSISKCEDQPLLETGMGRLVALESKQTISDVIARTKAMTGLRVVRCAVAAGHSMATEVKTGGVCAGSGASLLRPWAGRADLVVTGEMGHHDVLEFAQCGTSVILLEHSNSERGFLSAVLKPKLLELFDHEVDVIVSEKDCDPLQFV